MLNLSLRAGRWLGIGGSRSEDSGEKQGSISEMQRSPPVDVCRPGEAVVTGQGRSLTICGDYDLKTLVSTFFLFLGIWEQIRNIVVVAEWHGVGMGRIPRPGTGQQIPPFFAPPRASE